MSRSRATLLRRFFLAFGAATTFACAPPPSLETQIGERVGCAPASVVIGRHHKNYEEETWAATCSDVDYRCSRPTQKARDGETVYRSGDTSLVCVPLEAIQASEGSATQAPEKNAPSIGSEGPALTVAAVPRSAVGFRLGSSEVAAERACVDAGHEWKTTASGYTCTGTPRDVGLPAHAYLKFCDDSLCDLSALAEISTDDHLETLKVSLRTQYGSTRSEISRVPADCPGKLVSCLAEGRAHYEASWRWKTGEQIIARTLLHDGRVYFAVRYLLEEATHKEPLQEGTVDGSAF